MSELQRSAGSAAMSRAPHRLYFPRELGERQVDALVAMINRVYFAGEGDLFGAGFQRTSVDEVRSLIMAGELLALEATLDDDTEPTVHGCMHLRRNNDVSFMFGMLAVSERARRFGFGSALLDHAECVVRQAQCSMLQLTLLSPVHEVHAHKRFLEAWYRRRGFDVVRQLDFSYPHPLAKVCEYRLFAKTCT